jgi:hypothetical protein
MRHLARHPDLGVELRQAGGVSIDVRRQKLEGDGLPQFQIVGAIDLTHTAAPEPTDDAIAAAENRAGIEAAMIDRPRRRQPSRRRTSARRFGLALEGARRVSSSDISG